MHMVSCFMWKGRVIIVMDDGTMWSVEEANVLNEPRFNVRRLIDSRLFDRIGTGPT